MTNALVVCPDIKADASKQPRTLKARLEEAMNLSEAIHLNIVEGLTFPVRDVSPSTILGAGQIERIAEVAKAKDVSVVIFDCTLTPMQQRNLERKIETKVIDRSALILEIFGERAQSREGKLQVELAALDYQKSRLVRSWTHLERQRGGFGFTGGPGESQIELDRRIIRDRILLIKKQLEKVVRTRGLHRHVRDAVPYPVVALVGYTNAGKSSLFNYLSGANVYAEDALFATLDPTTRKVILPSGIEILLADTVGFISNLPTQLIAAFRATLEEVKRADILLHVRDITHEDSDAQRDDVNHVITELYGKDTKLPPIIEVWNKIDLADEVVTRELSIYTENPVGISAVTGQGIDNLCASLDAQLQQSFFQLVQYTIPLSDGKAQAWLHQHGVVAQSQQTDNAFILKVKLNFKDIQRFKRTCGHIPDVVQQEMLV
jgi:GTPase